MLTLLKRTKVFGLQAVPFTKIRRSFTVNTLSEKDLPLLSGFPQPRPYLLQPLNP